MSAHMPSAQTLRRAAAKVRTTAEAATPGPWVSLDGGDRIIRDTAADVPEYVVDEPVSHEGNAAHIALWHPAVALAVAGWLESEAVALAEFEDTTRPLGFAARHIHHDFNPAVRVAHLLLGEEGATDE